MQTAGVMLLLATSVLGFAQQDDAPGVQKIRTCTGLELQVVLPVVNAPFRVYFAPGTTTPPGQATPSTQPPVIVSSATGCDPSFMFDTAVHDEQSGRLDRAKLTLLALASTYSGSPLAAKAKVEIGAIYIFEEAQVHAKAGHPRAAYNSCNVLVLAYPESALARLASAEMATLDPEGKWKR